MAQRDATSGHRTHVPPTCTCLASPGSSKRVGCRDAGTVVVVNCDAKARTSASATTASSATWPRSYRPSPRRWPEPWPRQNRISTSSSSVPASPDASRRSCSTGRAPGGAHRARCDRGSKNLSGGCSTAGCQGRFPTCSPTHLWSAASPATSSSSSTPTRRSLSTTRRAAGRADQRRHRTAGKARAWLADQCEAEGVFVMTGVRVDALLTEDGGSPAYGRRGQLHARVVVAADG